MNAITDPLRLLEAEIEYRLSLQKFSRENLSSQERLDAYEQAGLKLRELRTGKNPLSSTYGHLLDITGDYAAAAVVAERLRRDVEREETREAEMKQIRATLDRVAGKLTESLNSDPVRWPDLTHELDRWEDDPQTPPLLGKLISLNRTMTRGVSLVALDAAKEAVTTQGNDLFVDGSEVRQKLVALVHELGYRRLMQYDEEPRWPFKMADGTRFGERLSNTVFLNGQRKNQIQGGLKALTKYKNLQEQLRADAGLIKPSYVWSLEHLGDEKIDQSLHAAINERIELFDPIPGDSEPEEIGVARLKAARDAADWVALQESLQSIEGQSQKLAEEVRTLRKQVEFFTVSLASKKAGSTRRVGEAALIQTTFEVETKLTGDEGTQVAVVSDGSGITPEDGQNLLSREKEHTGAGDSRSSTSQRHRLIPAFLGVVLLGLVSVLLLFLPISPLYRVWEKGAAAEEWTVTIAPFDTGSPLIDERQDLVITVRDGAGASQVGQSIRVETHGDGTLTSEQSSGDFARRGQTLLVRTGEKGARISYTPARAGDQIIAAIEGRTETFTYTIPDAPTLPPTPSAATPTLVPAPEPQPELSMDIRVDIDGQESTVAQPFQQLNYTIQLNNNGTGEARNVALQCKSPLGVYFRTSTTLLMDEEGMLSREGILIEPDQPFVTSLAFTVRADAPEDTAFVLACTVTYGETSTQGVSRAIRLEKPEPILVTLLPDRLDLGVDESVDLMIRVTQGSAGTPITNTQLTLQVEPATLLAAVVDPVRTNQNGEAVVTLQASQVVGSGRVTVQLAGSNQLGSADLIVHPVVMVRQGVNIRRGPANSDQLASVPDRSKPFVITGQSEDREWWQIQLSGSQHAWVSKNGLSPTVPIGNVADVPIVSLVSGAATPVTPETRRLQSPRQDEWVPFYLEGSTTDIILTMPAAGQLVDFITGEPSEFEVVMVTFWLPKDFLRDTGGATPVKLRLSTNTAACWDVPNADPSTLPNLCGEMLARSTELDVESSSLDVDGDWRKVTVRAWIKEQNLQ